MSATSNFLYITLEKNQKSLSAKKKDAKNMEIIP